MKEIKFTQVEIRISNILNSLANAADNELKAAIANRDGFTEILENKYDAVFDPESGTLKPKEKAKKKEKK